MYRTNRSDTLIFLFIAFIIALALLHISNSPARGATSEEVSYQDYYERQVEWAKEATELDTEYGAATNRNHAADITGNNIVLALNHIQWLDENKQVHDCGMNAWQTYTNITMDWLHVYTAFYHFLSSTVGEPADLQYWLDTQQANVETHTLLSECVSLLDT
jgi:hypothetical protein